MATNKFAYGGHMYTQYKSGSAVLENSIGGDELSYDTLSLQIQSDCLTPILFAPSDYDALETSDDETVYCTSGVDLRDYTYGEPLLWYHDDTLRGRFYVESIKRTGMELFDFACVSAVGLLVNSKHYGGIYSGTLASVVIADIIGGAFAYTIDAALGALPLYGWLPVDTRRGNLHQVLFAIGAAITKDTSGDVVIAPLTDSAPVQLPDKRIYEGGNIDYTTPATGVDVTEHAFAQTPNDTVSTLFEGEANAAAIMSPSGASLTGMIVEFEAPAYDLACEGATILESGVNYAVLSGSVHCVLTGKSYTHTTRTVSLRADNASGADNIYTSANATLVSLANANRVAQRLMAYYGHAKTVSVGIVTETERPGDAVSFTDPFGDPQSGIIASMDVNLSGVLKADTLLTTNYTPGQWGNNYSTRTLVTEGGNITIPEGVTKLRAVLIGGGDGGGPGADGAAGTKGTANDNGTGGEGGEGGQPGSGGKILIVDMDVTPGQVIAAAIGEGGLPGQAGGATTFGAYSSDDGTVVDVGYLDVMQNTRYGYPGQPGIKGGKGNGSEGAGESITYKGVTYVPGTNGVNARDGATIGAGGLGGGAAAGADGNNGHNGRVRETSSGDLNAVGGDGGDGADAVQADNATVYGCGGHGGHGGGGGGAGGGAKAASSDLQTFGWAGAGGSGGLGGNGMQGCLLLYW